MRAFLIAGLLGGLALCSDPALAGQDSQVQILVTFAQPQPVAAPRTGARAKYLPAATRYGASLEVARSARAVAREYGLRQVDAWPIVPLGVHCVVFELSAAGPLEGVLAALAADPRVESAQRLQRFEVLADARPPAGGAVAGVEPGYDDPYVELQYSVRELQLEAAHRWASGRGVDVAVIDTGIDTAHPELAGRIAAAEDFVEPRVRAGEKHGTAVAGIIAAAAGNGIGIVGVAPAVRLLALRACWPEHDRAVCSSFTLAKALGFALERAPRVINLSLAGPQDPLLQRLLTMALERGIAIVAACRAPACDAFPASMSGVIAVSAADLSPADGSVRALRAPGKDVITTMPDGAFDFVSGSSIAAAHVSGIAALLLERRPDLGPAALRRALAASARGGDPAAVLVNACEALATLIDGAGCPVADTG